MTVLICEEIAKRKDTRDIFRGYSFQKMRAASIFVSPDVISQVVSWLGVCEQFLFCATCSLLGSLGASSIVGPLTIDSNQKLSKILRLVDAGRLRSLASVTFSGFLTELDAPQLLKFVDKTQLRSLTLRGMSRLGDDALAATCQALGDRLRSINICECDMISDDGIIPSVLACPEIRTFRLKASSSLSRLTDASVAHLAKSARRLKVFDVSGCGLMTDASLEALAEYCRNMQCLYLRGNCRFTQRGIRAIASKTPRKIVECSLVSPADGVIDSLVGPMMRRLTLDMASPWLSDKALEVVGRRCPNLLQFKLYVHGCRDDYHSVGRQDGVVTDKGIVAVARGCSFIQTLTLVACGEWGAVESFKALPRLTSVSLTGKSVVTDAVVRTLVRHCTHIRRIFFSASTKGRLGISGLTALQAATSLTYVYIGMPTIELEMSEKRRVADIALARIVSACPRLLKLSIQVDYWQQDDALGDFAEVDTTQQSNAVVIAAVSQSSSVPANTATPTHLRRSFVYELPNTSRGRRECRERSAALLS